MNTTAAVRSLHGASLVASSLFLLAACGGGDEACTNVTFCPAPISRTSPPPSPGTAVSPTPTVAALALAPSSLTIGNCTIGVPFVFRGGQAPYTVFTSHTGYVPVTAPLRLDADRFYFFADVHFPPADTVPGPEVTSTVTVLDGQSQTAVATITTPLTPNLCPEDPPPFRASPESANFRTSEIRDFTLTGGSGTPTVTFFDAGVAQVISVSASTVTVQAVATVSATTLMTIAGADGQRTSVVINVLPQP